MPVFTPPATLDSAAAVVGSASGSAVDTAVGKADSAPATALVAGSATESEGGLAPASASEATAHAAFGPAVASTFSSTSRLAAGPAVASTSRLAAGPATESTAGPAVASTFSSTPAATSSPASFARAVVFGSCGFLGREVTRQLLAAGTQVLGIDTRPWPEALPQGYAHSDKAAAALSEAAAFLRGAAAANSTSFPPVHAAQHLELRSAGQNALPAPHGSPLPPTGIPKGRGPLAGVQGAAPPDSSLSPSPSLPAAFFHLAGLADAGACQRDPALARALNVDLVAEALAALRGTGAAFVFPSTGIVYGDGLSRPAREDDPLPPGQEYARGKIEAEGLVRAACAEGGVCAAIARLSNLYGPGGGENTVLGRILAQARRGEPLRVWDESPVRDFLYVADAAEGLIRLGLAASALPSAPASAPASAPVSADGGPDAGPDGGPDGGADGAAPVSAELGCYTANLSTGVGTRIGQLLDLGAELFHTSRLPQEREPDPAQTQAQAQAQTGAKVGAQAQTQISARVSSLVLDNSRLAALTGWRPSTPLAKGLRACL